MGTTSLIKFINLVPVCAQNASLPTLLESFSQAQDGRIIVLNDQQQPIGVIRLHSLLPYLLSGNTIAQEDMGGFPGTTSSTTFNLRSLQDLDLQHLDLQHLVSQTGLPVVEPLATLPVELTQSQLELYLRDTNQLTWAVVDSVGQFLGLLDSTCLLKHLAANRAEAFSEQDHVASSQPRSEANKPRSRHITPLSSLVELLEQLPLPLMLQTGTGQVLAQNLAWRTQVEGLQDPGWIQQNAATVLESAPIIEEQANEAERQSSDIHQSIPQMQSSQTQLINQPGDSANASENFDGKSPGLCWLGDDANTCVCICPMKDGRERIWQFVKIPLGSVSSGSGFNTSERWSSVSPLLHTLTVRDFRLASLRASADSSSSEIGAIAALFQEEPLWLILAQDTTEQQQVAKELAAKNADLVQLNRLKDEFLSCISHELKTPLTAVLGLSSLLKEQVLGELNERQARYADLIYQSGRHLMTMVNDILDLTRIETGQLELLLEPVTIQTVCDRAYEQALHLQPLEEKSTDEVETTLISRFTLEIEPGLETLVVDELRLRQMLSNLLSNALKFTEADGAIGLNVNRWEGWIAFTVWDTGIGIPVEKQHLIFQKFQQLENPLTRRFEGTGLGLVLTQRLARLHGGDVTFTSQEGQGSQFTLLLPPCPPQLQNGQEITADFLEDIDSDQTSYLSSFLSPASHPSSYQNRLVLIVEAVPRFIDDLTEQLSELGYRVAIARSGTEALEKARRLQPCAVFLNPVLPLLSGWDVLTLLKSDAETQHIPVIVAASSVEREQAYRNQANGFLSLPVQLKALQQSLEHLIDQPNITQQRSSSRLTILRLSVTRESEEVTVENAALALDLNSLLHSHHYRVLEVDDLDQAELLARVWKPDVLLLDGAIADPKSYLQELGQQTLLASLPLITLTPEVTQAANQVPGLAVFPCLTPLATKVHPASGQPETAALLQVIQVAAGISWKPHILIFELSTLSSEKPDNVLKLDGFHPAASESELADANTRASTSGFKQSNEWVQALIQYIQTAGFRGSTGHSWEKVLRQLEYQTIDLLLLCFRDTHLHPVAIEALEAWKQVDQPPPILVLDCRSEQAELANQSPTTKLPAQVEAIATKILPPSLSMKDLLNHVNQALISSKSTP